MTGGPSQVSTRHHIHSSACCSRSSPAVSTGKYLHRNTPRSGEVRQELGSEWRGVVTLAVRFLVFFSYERFAGALFPIKDSVEESTVIYVCSKHAFVREVRIDAL